MWTMPGDWPPTEERRMKAAIWSSIALTLAESTPETRRSVGTRLLATKPWTRERSERTDESIAARVRPSDTTVTRAKAVAATRARLAPKTSIRRPDRRRRGLDSRMATKEALSGGRWTLTVRSMVNAVARSVGGCGADRGPRPFH